MALTATLANLRQRAQQRADQENSTLCSTAEWNQWINDGWRELYEALIGWGQEYYLSSAPYMTTVGVDTYALPADFWRARGVDALVGGETLSLRSFMFEERNRYKLSGTWRRGEAIYYRLRGSNIAFIPAPTVATTITLWYYPTPVTLVNDADTIDGVVGWDDFVVLHAARKAAVKEESLELAAELLSELQAQKQRIQDGAPPRDAGYPERVQDVVGWGWD